MIRQHPKVPFFVHDLNEGDTERACSRFHRLALVPSSYLWIEATGNHLYISSVNENISITSLSDCCNRQSTAAIQVGFTPLAVIWAPESKHWFLIWALVAVVDNRIDSLQFGDNHCYNHYRCVEDDFHISAEGDKSRIVKEQLWETQLRETQSTAEHSGREAMKIAIYSHSIPPAVDGVSRRMASLLQHLTKEGHEVNVMHPYAL